MAEQSNTGRGLDIGNNFGILSEDERLLLSELLLRVKNKDFDKANNAAKKLADNCLHNPEILYFCAMHFSGVKDYEAALRHIKQAIALSPDNAKYISGLGLILIDQKKKVSTVEELKEATSLEIDAAQSVDTLFYQKEQSYINAEMAYLEALKIDSENYLIYHYLGSVQKHLGKLSEAEANLNKAIQLNPGYIQSFSLLGIVLTEMGKTDEARRAFRQALEIDSGFDEAKLHLGYLDLLTGDFSSGWDNYEARLSLIPTNADKINGIEQFPVWKEDRLPEDLPLLVLPEQGIGDEIMFSSLIPDLKKQCKNTLVFACEARLVSTLRRTYDDICISTLYDLKVPKQCYRLYIGSLPRYFRNRIEDFNPVDMLLKVDEKKKRYFYEKYLNVRGYKIGISWKSGNPTEGAKRSIPLENLSHVFSGVNVTLFNLQYGDHESEIERYFKKTGQRIINDGVVDPLNDLDTYMAFVSTLDLIITVDNSTAHIGGALGVPSWVLLPTACDWRWMSEGTDSLWYQSLKLFRQKEAGCWLSVLADVKAELAGFCQTDHSIDDRLQDQKGNSGCFGKVVQKKKVAFLNDTTSWYHWGCTATSEAIRKRIIQRGYECVNIPILYSYNFQPIPQNLYDFDSSEFINQAIEKQRDLFEALNQCEKVVINGEGSIHHISNVSLAILYMAYACKKWLGKPVHIINHSPYPANNREPQKNAVFDLYKSIYNHLDYIAIREHISFRLMTAYGVDATLSFDCLPITVTEDYLPGKGGAGKNLVISGSVAFKNERMTDLVRLMIHYHQKGYQIRVLHGAKENPAYDDQLFLQELQQQDFKHYEVINAKTLNQWLDCINMASVFVSGRFHHTLAALYLNTPCVMMESNTYKNVALAEMFGLPEPIQFDSGSFFEELLERTEKAPDQTRVQKRVLSEMRQRSELNFLGL